jgi:hypothetical protein
MSSNTDAARGGVKMALIAEESTIDLAADYVITTVIASFKPDDHELQLRRKLMARELAKVDGGAFLEWLDTV